MCIVALGDNIHTKMHNYAMHTPIVTATDTNFLQIISILKLKMDSLF